MVGRILLFAAAILLGTGVVVALAGGGGGILLLPAGILVLVGLLLGAIGLSSTMRGAAASKENAHIMQTGTEADGTVTFVDRNYSLLVNKRPIYSIVEYTYKDPSGRDHVRRIDNVPSDLVIRSKIEVGGAVKVKYLREDPAKSVLLFK